MNVPKITAAHYSKGRGGHKPRLIVIHTMETPESPARAKQVATWFAGHTAPQASAHYCVDDKQIYECVDEADTAWAVDDFDLNQQSISIELAGSASQTFPQWNDLYSHNQMILVVALVADIAKRNAIPLARVSGIDILTKSGICGHVDITMAKAIKGGHTDPGKNYPYTALIERAKAIK